MSGEKKTLELDKYEYGVIFHALKDERNQMIKEGRPSDAVDDVLLKVIELIEEPPEKETDHTRPPCMSHLHTTIDSHLSGRHDATGLWRLTVITLTYLE